MPRGKNYVNNNRGVTLEAPRKGGVSMEMCFYGSGCTRVDCIYRHDRSNVGVGGGGGGLNKSTEPCMAYLAGQCTFSDAGCRKRHPGQVEVQRLVAKYQRVPCRHGVDCKTQGCLYIHPGAHGMESGATKGADATAFPPLPSSHLGKPAATTTSPGMVASAWRAAPITHRPVVVTPLAPKNAWVQQRNVTAGPLPSSAYHANAVAITDSASTSSSGSLNINAKEFVPGFLH